MVFIKGKLSPNSQFSVLSLPTCAMIRTDMRAHGSYGGDEHKAEQRGDELLPCARQSGASRNESASFCSEQGKLRWAKQSDNISPTCVNKVLNRCAATLCGPVT